MILAKFLMSILMKFLVNILVNTSVSILLSILGSPGHNHNINTLLQLIQIQAKRAHTSIIIEGTLHSTHDTYLKNTYNILQNTNQTLLKHV